jgi:hypothetical protein
MCARGTFIVPLPAWRKEKGEKRKEKGGERKEKRGRREEGEKRIVMRAVRELLLEAVEDGDRT